MKLIAPLVALALLAAPVAQAQEFHRNAYGMYAAPVMYGFAKGTEYELATSGGGMDLGVYYAHAFNAGFSARIEAKYGTRELDDVQWTDQYAYVPFRLSESIVEIPVVLEADRRIPVSEHELRVSVGAGASYKYVLDQKLLVPNGNIEDYGIRSIDSYQKVGILLDGGTTFAVDRKSAIFLRLRFDWDMTTFGEPIEFYTSGEPNIIVTRRFWDMGFYAGFEYGL